jgi:hypothetical protein
MRLVWRTCVGCLIACSVEATASAQTPLTWPEVRARFESSNPTLQAGQIGIDESRAAEITAYLRPNPQGTLAMDQIGHTVGGNLLSASNVTGAFNYLHERQRKRELRRDSAQDATAIGTSAQADLERNLIFTLRSAFVQVLQAKAFRTSQGGCQRDAGVYAARTRQGAVRPRRPPRKQIWRWPRIPTTRRSSTSPCRRSSCLILARHQPS